MASEDFLLNIDDLPWHSLGERTWFRLLRHSPESGHFVIILRLETGAKLHSHKHYGPAEFMMLKGSLAYGESVANAGSYGWEGMHARHDATNVDVDTELLFIAHGPIIFDAVGDQPGLILEGALLAGIASGETAPVSISAERAEAA